MSLRERIALALYDLLAREGVTARVRFRNSGITEPAPTSSSQ